MKLSDFILLDIDEKKNTVLHEGVLIAKRSSSGKFVFLFQLDHFYVEAFCNINDKAVEEFRVSRDTVMLTPYLESIEIGGLVT